MTTLEFFFDCSSPWTYIGFHNVRKLSARLDVPIIWKPIIVGGVFNKVNKGVYEFRERVEESPVKAAYIRKDMADWARHAGLTLNFPPKCGHPVNAVKCMRACLFLAPEGKLVDFATAAFEALWIDGLNLGDDDVLEDICRKIGVDSDRVLKAVKSDEMRAALYAVTEELMDRGGFGSPTFFVDRAEMFFGNDRLPLVESALQRSLRASRETT